MRARRITQMLKRKDPSLYCEESPKGYLQVLRKTTQMKSVYLNEHDVITYSVMVPEFIVALTDNWTVKGTPVEWGLDPIMRKIIAMDTWDNKEAESYQLQSIHERSEKSKERARHHEQEAFCHEFRRGFAKAFNDVNTSTLKKIDRRSNGNC